jgi:hypothetical protein
MTCGLRITPSPTSDNLTPQETTAQLDREVGADGSELSCPGSSVVAGVTFRRTSDRVSVSDRQIVKSSLPY